MEVRDATSLDVEKIHRIYTHYVGVSLATLALEEPALEQTEEIFRSITSMGLPFIVGIDAASKSVCGYAYGAEFNSRQGYRYTVEDTVYLAPEYLGKGLGKTLLLVILQRLKAAGKQHVIAKVSIMPELAVSNSPSCRLHLSLGFTEVGRLRGVGVKFDKVVDVAILQLSLESESPRTLI